MLNKIVPATRTFVMRRTSKTTRAAVEKAIIDTVVVRRSGVKFSNGEGLQDKLNGWSTGTARKPHAHKPQPWRHSLGEGGAQTIAAALLVNIRLTVLNAGLEMERRESGFA
jgi:hypothetical protein